MTAQPHHTTPVVTADPALTLVPDEYVTAEQALAAAQKRAAHLEEALASSRVIGMAVGIVIERCHLGSDDAFTLLVTISQRDHRKLRDIASDLVFTGVIPDGQ